MKKNFRKFLLATVIIIISVFVFVYYNYNKEKENIFNDEKIDDFFVTKTESGSQVIENKTKGYSLEIPTEGYVEKPDQGNIYFRVFPSGDNKKCDYFIFHKWPNPESKSVPDYYKKLIEEHTRPGEVEYVIEPYDKIEGAYYVLSTEYGIPPARESRGIYIADKDSVYSLSISTESPFIEDCEELIKSSAQSLKFYE